MFGVHGACPGRGQGAFPVLIRLWCDLSGGGHFHERRYGPARHAWDGEVRELCDRCAVAFVHCERLRVLTPCGFPLLSFGAVVGLASGPTYCPSSPAASSSFMADAAFPEGRKLLALYPVLLFYLSLAWMVLIGFQQGPSAAVSTLPAAAAPVPTPTAETAEVTVNVTRALLGRQ